MTALQHFRLRSIWKKWPLRVRLITMHKMFFMYFTFFIVHIIMSNLIIKAMKMLFLNYACNNHLIHTNSFKDNIYNNQTQEIQHQLSRLPGNTGLSTRRVGTTTTQSMTYIHRARKIEMFLLRTTRVSRVADMLNCNTMFRTPLSATPQL